MSVAEFFLAALAGTAVSLLLAGLLGLALQRHNRRERRYDTRLEAYARLTLEGNRVYSLIMARPWVEAGPADDGYVGVKNPEYEGEMAALWVALETIELVASVQVRKAAQAYVNDVDTCFWQNHLPDMAVREAFLAAARVDLGTDDAKRTRRFGRS